MAETKPVRQGEEIDIKGLRAFLEGELGTQGAIEIEQFPGGSSNLTYLVRIGQSSEFQLQLASDARPGHLKMELETLEFVLRRPPFGNTVKTAHDMRREFDVLLKLSAVYQPAPKPLLFCGDETIIGSDFYLMERRRGLIIRGKIPGTHHHLRSDLTVGKAGLPPLSSRADQGAGASRLCGLSDRTGSRTWDAFDIETSQTAREAVCRSFIKNLADLHTLDHKAAGLESLGRIDGYNRRQVEGWTKRYFAAKTHDWDALEKAIEWLNSNVPPESGASLIHNDYKFDNVMLDPANLGRITAVLDWEMVTVGDPLMDLGTTLGYWMSSDAGEEMMSMPFNPRVLMENISRKELVEMYAENVGRIIPDMLFYYVFGTFKIAVIAQQIYARYVKGFTKDQRFAGFDKFVAALGRIANGALERGTI